MTSYVTFYVGSDVSTSSIDFSTVAVVVAVLAAAVDIYASHAGGGKCKRLAVGHHLLESNAPSETLWKG